MVYNYGLLQWKIKEVFGTQAEFAKSLGVTKQYVSKVLHSHSYLSQTQISKWCELLGIEDSEIPSYFFAH